MSSPTAAPRRRLFTARRALYTLALAGAGVAAVSAFLIHPEPKPQPRDPAIVAVSPEVNATELRQTTISVDLAATYTGVLQIDAREIPEDQTERILTGGNRVSFTPGPNKEFPRFAPGRHCAAAVFWPTGQTRETASRTYVWCFTLH